MCHMRYLFSPLVADGWESHCTFPLVVGLLANRVLWFAPRTWACCRCARQALATSFFLKKSHKVVGLDSTFSVGSDKPLKFSHREQKGLLLVIKLESYTSFPFFCGTDLEDRERFMTSHNSKLRKLVCGSGLCHCWWCVCVCVCVCVCILRVLNIRLRLYFLWLVWAQSNSCPSDESFYWLKVKPVPLLSDIIEIVQTLEKYFVV